MAKKYEDLIKEKAKKYGVNPQIAKAVVQAESGGNPFAKSSKGAQGLMQLMPGTAKELGVQNPFDPEENVDAGVRYLGQMIEKFGDTEKGLAAYNAGPGNVKKYGGIPPFKETQNYVNKVLNTSGYRKAPRESSLPNLDMVTTTLPASGRSPESKGALATLGRLFKVGTQSRGADDLGERTPEIKEGVGSKILSFAAPLLFGAFPNPIMAALAGNIMSQRRGQISRAEQEQAATQAERAARLKQMAPSAMQKQFEEYQAMSPEEKEAYEEFRKLSGQGMSPSLMLALDKFGYQKERDLRQIKRREGEQLEKGSKDLSKELRPTQSMQSALSQIEKELGFKMDDYDEAENTVKGEKINIPGFNVPGVGRVTKFSSKARGLDSAIKRIYNTILKERSGAAVTNPEYARFINEFEAGRFNTEQDMLRGLKRFKRGLNADMQNIEAAYPNRVVEAYKSRGGKTSEDFISEQPELTEDEEARIWLLENPNHPEAENVRRSLGE